MNPLAGIGKALRDLRRAAGLSQDELAKLASLQPSMLSRYERGARTPHVATLAALLEALGADLHDLADALDAVNGREPPDRAIEKAIAGGSSDAAIESMALHIARQAEKLAAALAELERVKGKPLTGSDTG